MAFREIIEKAQNAFNKCADTAELMRQVNKLDAVVKDEIYYEENRKDAEALMQKLILKYAYISLVEKEYTETEREFIGEKIKIAESISREKEYKNTLNLTLAVKEEMEKITPYIKGLRKLYGTWHDGYGDVDVLSYDILVKAAAEYEKRLLSIRGDEIFGSFEFLGIKSLRKSVEDYLDKRNSECRTVMRNYKDEYYGKKAGKVLNLVSFDRIPRREYFPRIKFIDGTNVVITPFEDEFMLVAEANAVIDGKGLCVIDLNDLKETDDTEEFLDYILSLIAEENSHYAFVDVHGYTSANRIKLFGGFVKLAVNGKKVFVHDERGDKPIYTELRKMWLDETVSGGADDYFYAYLSMPDYLESVNVLKKEEIILDGDESFFKAECAFSGFVGLNRAKEAKISGKDPKRVLTAISRDREGRAKIYMTQIPSQSQFIDFGWGTLTESNVSVRPRKKLEYDYDLFKEYSEKNIRAILDVNGVTLAERCGLAAKYCLLYGDDESVWKDLSDEEKLKRITVATKMVARMLNNEYDPGVVVKEKLSSEKAGGICIGHGARIEYKKSAIENIDWLIGCVCHECFHGFQHTIQNNGWQPWHLTEVGVNKYRVDEWRKNYSMGYVDIDNNYTAYYVQIVEADTHIFENEAFAGASDKWHLLDLE